MAQKTDLSSGTGLLIRPDGSGDPSYEQQPEEMRLHIDETRGDLIEKLEALEHKVMHSVGDARSSVADTVQAMKDTVHDGVDSVKYALDLSGHVQRHPWSMLASAVATGYVLSQLLPLNGGDKETRRQGDKETGNEAFSLSGAAGSGSSPTPPLVAGRNGFPPHGERNGNPPHAEPKQHEPSWLSRLADSFAPEIQELKGLAIGSLMAVARDLIKQSVSPPLAPELEGMVDRMTTRMGGVPLQKSEIRGQRSEVRSQ